MAAVRALAGRSTDGAADGSAELLEDLDVRSAVKAAAGAAALGATFAAARALAERSSAEPETEEPETEEPETEEPEPERDVAEPQLREQPPEEEPEPDADEPSNDTGPERSPSVHGAELDDVKRVVAAARAQLEALQSRPVEAVSGVERGPDGWRVSLEVVELARIPESTDVLATYEVELDDDANLQRYSRGRRYHRAQADDLEGR